MLERPTCSWLLFLFPFVSVRSKEEVHSWEMWNILVTSLLKYFSALFLSWIFARKWPGPLHGPQLGVLCSFLSISAWIIVVSPVAVLILWGSWLILILGRDIIGLAVIMAGIALLLAFYSIMLWWRTQWQSSSMSFISLCYFFSSYCSSLLLLVSCTLKNQLLPSGCGRDVKISNRKLGVHWCQTYPCNAK